MPCNYMVACQVVTGVEHVRMLCRAEVRISMPYSQVVTCQIVTIPDLTLYKDAYFVNNIKLRPCRKAKAFNI